MTAEREGVPQMPGPDEGEPPRSERDPRHPTATAPDSVEESVYDEAEYAGKDGADAADPPTAARKAEDAGAGASPDDAPGKGAEVAPGADLDPDEAADVMETREEAHEIKQTRDDQQDEDLVSLDPSD